VWTYRRQYAALGAAFGLAFPMLGTAIEALQRGHGLSLAGALASQRASALLWIIDSAPFWLGLFASLAGARQDRLGATLRRLELANASAEAANRELGRLNAELEDRVRVRTEELEVSNRELLRLARVKDRFLASVSHELRTPLNAILGFSRIVLRKTRGQIPERQSQNLELVCESGEHLLRLVNDMLDMQRIESERLELSMGPVDAAALLGEVREGLAAAASRKGLDLSTRAEPLTLWTDRARLRQVLDNLVNNAIKYSDSGRVEAWLEADADRVTFRVKDEGIGMSAADLATIFEPFRQLEGASTRGEGGVGLGLHLVQKLVALLGGRVEVASAPGEGSTFSVIFPKAAVTAAEGASAS
jgi:signal transduction histidine kinase